MRSHSHYQFCAAKYTKYAFFSLIAYLFVRFFGGPRQIQKTGLEEAILVICTLRNSTSGKRSTKLATRKVSTVTTNYIDIVANISIAVASGGTYMFSKGRPKASL